MDFGRHILQRRGPKRWPPGWFSGQPGCGCCPATPDPAYYPGSSYNPRDLWACCRLSSVDYNIPKTLYCTITSATASCFNNRTVALIGCVTPTCEWEINSITAISGGSSMAAPCSLLGCRTTKWSNTVTTGCSTLQRIAINFKRTTNSATEAKYTLSIEQRLVLTSGCVQSAESAATSCVPFLWSASMNFTALDAYCNGAGSGVCGGSGSQTLTFTVTE